MDKAHLGVLFFLVLVALPMALAGTVEEKTFKQMVYDDFAVSGTNTEKCEEYAFIKANDENYTILSAHAEFLPNAESRIAGMSVYLNDSNAALTFVRASSFLDGWARIILPKEQLREMNKVKLCAKTSDVVVQARILNDSTIGTYRIADFSLQGAFTQTVSSHAPQVGEEITVRVKLHNYGNEETFVSIKHREANVEMPEIEITHGETEKNGWIAPNGEIVMEYYIKPKAALKMSIPYAVAEYKNTFGESVRLASTMPTLQVKAIEQKLSAVIVPETSALKSGERTKLAVAVKNNSADTISNIFVSLVLPDEISLDGTNLAKIPSLEPGESTSMAFYVSAQKAGSYRVGCSLTYDSTPQNCELITLTYEEQGINYIVIAGVVLLVVALAIYIYLYFSPEKRRSAE